MAIRALLLTCLIILTNNKYNVLGTKTIDIHMSNTDPIDDETKRILAEVDSDDSKESEKAKKETQDNDRWERNNIDDDDSEW